VWGGRPPEHAASVLHSSVSRLRRTLKVGSRGKAMKMLVTRGRGYQLLVEDQQLDSLAFERLVEEGRRALADDPSRAADVLRNALGLCRGEVLADVRDHFVDRGQITHLDNLKAVALEARVEADLALGRHHDVVGELEALIGKDPLHEGLRRHLMLALYRSGRPADAIDVYWDACQLLDDQYGVTPGKELQQLHRAIKLRDPALDWAPGAVQGQHQMAPQRVEAAPRVGFVGRDVELAQLRVMLADARAGQGRLVLIGGEMGIGKSRLAHELTDEARTAGMQVLLGWMWEADGAPACWPWVQILRSLMETSWMESSWMESSEPDRLGQLLGPDAAVIAQLLPEIAERLPGLPDPPHLKPAEARFRLFDAVTRVLKRAASTRALVLWLDDLHRADVPSLRLLQFLAHELSDAHILVLGTLREEKADQTQALVGVLAELSREPVTYRMNLEGLSENHVARFVELATGIEASPPLIAKLYERTNGNPLFLNQLVQPLAQEGDPRRFEEELDEHVPQQVLEVVQWRLEQLSDDARIVLAAASVMGRQFPLDVLGTVSGRGAGRLLELVEEATALGFLGEVSGKVGWYRFSHVLVRDALYRQLSGPRRARLHHQIGEALEERYADDPNPRLTELAHHFLQAGDRAKALAYVTRAGERAMALLAYEEAARLFEVGLGQDPDEAHRCALLLALADARMKAGDTVNARNTFLRAAENARALGASEQLAHAALGFGERLHVTFACKKAKEHMVELLEEALGALGTGDSPLRARMLGRLAMALSRQPAGRQQAIWERRIALSQEAVEMARRLGDTRVLASVLDARCFVLLRPDALKERLELAAEICALAVAAGDREIAQQGRIWRIVGFLELGDVATVDAELGVYVRVAEELRQPAYLYWAHIWQGTRALMAGRFEQAEQHNLQALIVGQRLGLDVAQLQRSVAAQLFWLRKEQGRLGEMEETIKNIMRELPEGFAWRAGLALLYATTGDEEAARREFEQLAAKDFKGISHDLMRLLTLATAAEVCAFLADRRRAAILYELLLPYEQRCVVVGLGFGYLGPIPSFLGQLASTMGDLQTACRHFEVALRINERTGAMPHLAHTNYHYARALLARDLPGGRERARVLLSHALQTAQELGMGSLTQQVLVESSTLHVNG
jgi:DNA-binding SARP family transcriptional activator/tetratricopeptide (TPR) repeat protein